MKTERLSERAKGMQQIGKGMKTEKGRERNNQEKRKKARNE